MWITVERHEPGTKRPGDEYTDLDLEFSSECEFDTEEAALEFAHRLHDVSQAMQGNSPAE